MFDVSAWVTQGTGRAIEDGAYFWRYTPDVHLGASLPPHSCQLTLEKQIHFISPYKLRVGLWRAPEVFWHLNVRTSQFSLGANRPSRASFDLTLSLFGTV